MEWGGRGRWVGEGGGGGLGGQGGRGRFAGLIPTPGIAYVAREGPFAAGVMISASHNPYQDNGIKIIDHSGFKLPDEQEHSLERDILEWCASGATPAAQKLQTDEGLDREYIEHLAGTLTAGIGGWSIAVDAGHGAATEPA